MNTQTTTNPEIETLNANAEAAKAAYEAAVAAAAEAKRKAEQELREAQRRDEEAKAEAARLERVAVNTKFAEALVSAIHAKGLMTAKIDGSYNDFPRVKITNGWDGNCAVEFEKIYSKGYRPTQIGIRIVVGNYGNRVSYPQNKAGEFNYEKIAETIVTRHNNQVSKDNAAQIERENKDASKQIAEALEAKHGLNHWWGPVQVSACGSDCDKVEVKINKTMTLNEEEADKLIAALKELGLLA